MTKRLVLIEAPGKISKLKQIFNKDTKNSYEILATVGHFTKLKSSGYYNLGVDLKNKFKPQFVIMDDKYDLLDKILKAANNADEIYIMSDADREGEKIAQEIYDRISGIDKPIKRAVFTEINEKSIMHAINNTRDIDFNLASAATCRQVLDKIVGFVVSPLLQEIYKNNHLSSGRVQSPLSLMVSEREQEIKSFIPENYWTISVGLTDKTTIFSTKYSNEKITSQTDADKIAKDLNENEYIVSSVIASEEKKVAPAPLITSTLQQIMSKKYSVGASETMDAAQKLYETGFISYHRTDSVSIPEEKIEEIREYLKDNKLPISSKTIKYKNAEEAQEAHSCIYPIDLSVKYTVSELPDEIQKKVYKTIYEYFLACQCAPAVYSTLKISLTPKSNTKAVVKASGKALKSKGYLEVLGIDDKSKIDIPFLNKGDVVYLSSNNSIKIEKKQTQPPGRYAEDKLIKELESKGIGRPATYANLLATITTRNYVEKKGNVYHATELGKNVNELLSKHFSFMDYNFTAKLEKELDLIAAGKTTYFDVLNNFFPIFKSELEKTYKELKKDICPLCNSFLKERSSKKDNSKFFGCSNFPNCKYIKK